MICCPPCQKRHTEGRGDPPKAGQGAGHHSKEDWKKLFVQEINKYATKNK